MNGYDVFNRVTRQFGDEASVQVTELDVALWINDAQKNIAVQNDLLQATGTLNTVIGVNNYSFPTDMLGLNKLYYNNLQLKYLNRNEYDLYINPDDPDGISTGTPIIYTRWANEFSLYPRPDAVGVLKLLYTQRPVDIDDLNDSLSLPIEYHEFIVKWCLQQAYEMDEDWDAAATKATQFDSGLSILKENEYSKGRDVYPTITVRPEDM